VKRCIELLFFLWLSVSAAFAQAPLQSLPEQDACNALKLCGGIFDVPKSYIGSGLFNEFLPIGLSPFGNNYTSEHHSVWFELDVATSGDIIFDLTAGSDYYVNYGFSIYDITNTGCGNLALSNLVRFTAWIGQGATGGLRPGYSTTLYSNFTLNTYNFLEPIHAAAGERYLLCVHQYLYPSRTGFSLDFTASTATFTNNSQPSFSSIVPSCNHSQKITVRLSEPVTCSSIAFDGSDFYLTPGNLSIASASGELCSVANYSREVDLHFATPLVPGQYWLHSKNGNDGNTLMNLCGSPQAVNDSIQFTVAPYSPLLLASVSHGGCTQTKVYFSHAVRCGSVAADGSDFKITGPSTVTIKNAIPLSCSSANDLTDSVLLLLDRPATNDGTYTLNAIVGSDGNTVEDSCGQELLLSDAVTFSVATFRPVITVNDTVLCSAQPLQLEALAAAVSPHNDTCSVNYGGSGFQSAEVQSESVNNTNPGVPSTTLAVISPFLKTYSDIRLQYLLRHDELKAMGLQPGLITDIGWFVIADRMVPTPFHNFTIKMGCTDEDSFSSTYISGTEMVFSVESYNVLNEGWLNIKLQTPYAWLDTSKNLVIEVCFDNSDLGSVGELGIVSRSKKDFTCAYLRYGNNLTGCAMTNTQGGFLRSQERPITRLSFSPPPDTGLKYIWTPSEGLKDTTISNPVANVQKSMTYTVSTTDNSGCYFQDTINIAISPYHGSINPQDTTICKGKEVRLTASGGEKFQWTASVPEINCTDCASPVVSPSVDALYTALITDKYGCCDTATATVHLYPDIRVVALPADTTVKYGSQLQLNAVTENASFYLWQPATHISDVWIRDPVATVYEPVNYIITVSNEYGCRASDTAHIGVDFRDKIFIPSAFSPNNDGLNDIFRIGNISFQKITEFSVFNRWGNQVFNTTDPHNGWDGSYKGTPQPVGTYFYIIRISYPDGYAETYKGDVTLIR
jgi:gliding motility-associated-like protein